ncbi:uncharacterized protein LOC144819731 [Lissotriton helveticus]
MEHASAVKNRVMHYEKEEGIGETRADQGIVEQQSQKEENEQQEGTRSQGQEEGGSMEPDATKRHERTEPRGLEEEDFKEPFAPEHHAHKEPPGLEERDSMELQCPEHPKPEDMSLLPKNSYVEAEGLGHNGTTKVSQELASNGSQDKKHQAQKELQKVGKQLIREFIFCGILCILHTLKTDMLSSFVCLSLYLSIFCHSSVCKQGTVKMGFREGHDTGEPQGQEEQDAVERPMTGSQGSADWPGPEQPGAEKLTSSEQPDYEQESEVTSVTGNKVFKDLQVVGVKSPKGRPDSRNRSIKNKKSKKRQKIRQRQTLRRSTALKIKDAMVCYQHMSCRQRGPNNRQRLQQTSRKVSQIQETSLQELQSLYNPVQEVLQAIQESGSKEMNAAEEACSEETPGTGQQSQKEMPDSRKDDPEEPQGQKKKGLKEQQGFKHQDKESRQGLQSHPQSGLQEPEEEDSNMLLGFEEPGCKRLQHQKEQSTDETDGILFQGISGPNDSELQRPKEQVGLEIRNLNLNTEICKKGSFWVQNRHRLIRPIRMHYLELILKKGKGTKCQQVINGVLSKEDLPLLNTNKCGVQWHPKKEARM